MRSRDPTYNHYWLWINYNYYLEPWFTCLLLIYDVTNFSLAWIIFKDNRRNSNCMLISVFSIMVFSLRTSYIILMSLSLGPWGNELYILNVSKWENEECGFMLNPLPYFRKESKVIIYNLKLILFRYVGYGNILRSIKTIFKKCNKTKM